MERQQFFRALLIMVLAAVFLRLYPLVYERVPFFQEHFRSYRFFESFLPGLLDSSAAADSTYVDNSGAEALAPVGPPPYSGLNNLETFFRSLSSGNEQVRLAYFSDSSTEGDIITASFRDSLQRRFGGQGIGFAPIVNPIYGFRRSLRHSYSENWYHCYIGKENEQGLPRGLSGEYFSTWQPPDTLAADTLAAGIMEMDTIAPPEIDNNFWVFYGNTRLFPGTQAFPTARLFYGQPAADSSGLVPVPGRIFVQTSKENNEFDLSAPAPVNEQELSETPIRNLRIDFIIPESLPIYGVSFESPSGVIVDNLPSRGNSGPALRQIPEEVLRSFQGLLDYDLLLFQFGLNVLNPNMKDYRWYEDEMVQMIRYFQAAMPEAAILLIGPSDKAIKMGSVMGTDPSVPRINASLRRAAERTGSAFFSFYEAMGGEGSMVEWVEQKQPRLANLDYTHFNFEGAKIAAGYLLEYLLTGFENWEEKENQE